MNICRHFLEFVIALLICINESHSELPKISENMKKMKVVKDRILNGYDKAIRPTEEGSNTTEVYTGFMPRQIIEVDEDRALLTLDSYFFLSWKDPRLAWDRSTEYDGDLPMSTDLLWLPDLSVYNSHSLQVNPMQQVPAILLPRGHVIWVPPVFTQTSCPALNEAVYPNEIVTCMVKFGSWTHDGWEIDFKNEGHLYMEEFLNINPRWEMIVSEVKLIRNVTYYEGVDEPYLSLDLILPMKRKMPPEINATRAPCICIMLLSLAIFWLPTNSSKKVLLGGYLLLALAILLVYVAWSTKYPLGVLFAVSFLQSTMYILVITLLLQVLVISNLCNITGPMRPLPIVMQVLTGPFGKYTFLKSSVNNSPIDRMQLKEDSPNTLESPTSRDDWMLLAAGLDRLFFVLMSIAMIAIHHL